MSESVQDGGSGSSRVFSKTAEFELAAQTEVVRHEFYKPDGNGYISVPAPEGKTELARQLAADEYSGHSVEEFEEVRSEDRCEHGKPFGRGCFKCPSMEMGGRDA